MIELAEALEKYTVVQLIFAFLVLLPTWGIVREIRGFRSGDNNQTDVDTSKILAETLGGIIANELEKVTQSVQDSQRTETEEHQGIVEALNEHGKIMERVALVITEHNNKSEEFRTTIGGLVGRLTGNLVKTNEAVEVMNTDIDKIKSDLEAVKNTVEHFKDKGLPLDDESRATMKQFIEAAEKLEKQLSKVTQEPPVTPKPKTAATPEEKTE